MIRWLLPLLLVLACHPCKTLRMHSPYCQRTVSASPARHISMKMAAKDAPPRPDCADAAWTRKYEPRSGWVSSIKPCPRTPKKPSAKPQNNNRNTTSRASTSNGKPSKRLMDLISSSTSNSNKNTASHHGSSSSSSQSTSSYARTAIHPRQDSHSNRTTSRVVIPIFQPDPDDDIVLKRAKKRGISSKEERNRRMRLQGLIWWMSDEERNHPRIIPPHQPWWQESNFPVDLSWTAVRLREEAKKRGLETKGLKAELVDRINRSYKEHLLTDDNFVDPVILDVEKSRYDYPCFPEVYEKELHTENQSID